MGRSMEPQKRKEQILAIAADIFAKKGYHETGVADIIEQAGIARGTFYLYFSSKRQVFTEVMSKILLELADRLEAVDPENKSESVVDQFRKNLKAIFNYFIEYPQMAKILLAQVGSVDSEAEQDFSEAHSMLNQVIRAYLLRGQIESVLRDFNVETYSYMILGGIREVVFHLVVKKDMDAQLDDIIEGIVRYNCFGILKENIEIE